MFMFTKKTIKHCTIFFVIFPLYLLSQYNSSKFHQLEEWLPTPNTYRTASGAPGHDYWQQRADYFIDVTLDDQKQRIMGKETIVYYNNSPDKLHYLWLQLDQNIFDKNSDTYTTETHSDKLEKVTFESFQQWKRNEFDGGIKDIKVTDEKGNLLKFTVVKTMMRIDLPKVLEPKSAYKFKVEWSFNINNHKTHGGRTGYEFFEKDGNYLYEMAHWFPRMCVYNDVRGWQHKQYLGNGEFALEFGDYVVNITVPSDHVVAATGVLQNPNEVLSATQIQRLEKAKTANKPVLIITQEEAIKNENAPKATTNKTWKFVARNVRDFAFASSRKFIWDAMGVKIGNQTVMAMSFYPKEANPLWEKYSTHAVAHTLQVYSRFTIDYPYPVAISVNGPVYGMEYPMICFNGPRPEPDGTYHKFTKYSLISVIIHEVGHNFFPMIISSDERQWTWMDEGLNTFVQYLAEKEWERDYPTRRGEPSSVIAYMSGDKSGLEPIMTNSESITQFGNNAYAKPAAALNILRETILGRELFDFAFKTYAQRWAFKHPEPADFFRTMEDATGIDLDWFWRGWFYSTDPVDIAITNVHWLQIDTQNPDIEKPLQKSIRDSKPKSIAKQRDASDIKKVRTDDFPELLDFYNTYDELNVYDYERKNYQRFLNTLNEIEKSQLQEKKHFYLVSFENKGGLVMPIILQLLHEDGTQQIQRIPAEIWRKNNQKVTKLFITDKPVKKFLLDPFAETADIDTQNNVFPPEITYNKFQLYKPNNEKGLNPMQLNR